MARDKLSKRQEAIYQFICDYTKDRGYPPSVREIGSAVGLASPSTVHMHLKVLQERGYIKRDSKKPRTIEVVTTTTEVEDTPEAPEQDLVASATTLPLVGQVAAGMPILAEQNVEEIFSLPTSIVGDSSSFILKVTGDSMIKAGIFEGDYIVVREQSDAVNGDIVVAMIDGEATVKTFYREDGRVRLQPANDYYEPIYANNPVILGRVTALIRSIS